MSIISVNNLSFAYEGSYDYVFENLSVMLDSSWKLGLTGRNGRGKTTFLRLLSGAYEGYSGTISAGLSFEYFPYDVAEMARTTSEVLSAINPVAAEWEFLREFSLLGLASELMYRNFCTLSNGERTKALLAALFLKENSFLLIDEPTNHLDMPAREKVSAYLSTKRGFILVSHDRAFLDGCVDHILSLNRSGIDLQRGSFSSWLENKRRQDSFELSENEKLKKEIGRLEESARRSSEWSDRTEKAKIGTKNSGLSPDRGYIGHKAAKMMARSKAIEGRKLAAAAEKSRLLKNLESAPPLKLSPLQYHSARLVEAVGLSLCYGDRQICRDVSFTIERGDKLALRGGNGTGKSSIIKHILGDAVPFEGVLRTGSGLEISYVPQDTSFLHGSLSDYAAVHGIDESLFKAILRKLGFSREQLDMADFSAGQKKKVLIAHSLCRKAHLYIWDEPLNYVDLLSRVQIEELLRDSGLTLLFVEHDRFFCDAVATKTVYLQQ